MSLDTFTNLQAEIADWANRTDLTSVIVTAITLAESEMKRRLRRSSTRTTITLSTEETSLPADCAEVRSLVLESGSTSRDVPLHKATIDMLAERKARNGGANGRPDVYIHTAGTLIVAPIPDATYTARILYYTALTPLSGSVASNAILLEAPELYLYGALKHLEAYLEHDDRIGTWKTMFDNAIAELNEVRDREEFEGGIVESRFRAFA